MLQFGPEEVQEILVVMGTRGTRESSWDEKETRDVTVWAGSGARDISCDG